MTSKHGCTDGEVVAECTNLRNSSYILQPFPQDKSIRFVIPGLSSSSLQLRLHKGLCNISCEGGNINDCETFKQNFTWNNTRDPFYFENLTSLHSYCVTATIGRSCCPIYTDTIFMEDTEYKSETFSTINVQWEILAIVLTTLIMFVGLGAAFCKGFKKRSNSIRHDLNDEKPFTQQTCAIDVGMLKTDVVCIYLRESEEQLLKDISSLKDFLEYKGFNVVDVYEEEDAIDTHMLNWVSTVMDSHNTKLVVVDTNALRSLLSSDFTRLRTFYYAIIYTIQCVQVNLIFNKLFVVSFQNRAVEKKGFAYLDSDRRYVFPKNKERLAADLLSLPVQNTSSTLQ